MTDVRDAARWLREILPPDGGWLPSRLLRHYADRDGHAWRTVLRARVRAGVGYRRVGFGPGQRSEWRLAEAATFGYRHNPRRSIDPPSSPSVDVVAMCSACGRSAVLPARMLPADCLYPGCDGFYDSSHGVPEPLPRNMFEIDEINDTKIAVSRPAEPSGVWPGMTAACPVCGRGQLVQRTGFCIYRPLCRGMFRVRDRAMETI